MFNLNDVIDYWKLVERVDFFVDVPSITIMAPFPKGFYGVEC